MSTESKSMLMMFGIVVFVILMVYLIGFDTSVHFTEDLSGIGNWTDVVLKNSNTGQYFTLKDYNQKKVLVTFIDLENVDSETQQNTLRSMQSLVSKVVFISLVDGNATDEQIKKYARVNKFDWTFAKITPNMSKVMDVRFGPKSLMSDLVPMILLCENKSVSKLPYSLKGETIILEAIQKGC